MTEINKEIVSMLTNISEKLGDIQYDLKDIKNSMPKVPYYGDLLEDINKNIERLNRM
jgi:hypothetical protein